MVDLTGGSTSGPIEHGFNNWILIVAGVFVLSFVGLFSYRLVRSLTERERKKEEKKKLKELKKKKWCTHSITSPISVQWQRQQFQRKIVYSRSKLWWSLTTWIDSIFEVNEFFQQIDFIWKITQYILESIECTCLGIKVLCYEILHSFQ